MNDDDDEGDLEDGLDGDDDASEDGLVDDDDLDERQLTPQAGAAKEASESSQESAETEEDLELSEMRHPSRMDRARKANEAKRRTMASEADDGEDMVPHDEALPASTQPRQPGMDEATKPGAFLSLQEQGSASDSNETRRIQINFLSEAEQRALLTSSGGSSPRGETQANKNATNRSLSGEDLLEEALSTDRPLDEPYSLEQAQDNIERSRETERRMRF